MLPHGNDRVRFSGGKLILLSPIPKGWTPRVPRTATSAEHPGTAVLWDEQVFEVLEAEPAHGGGARYLLAPWRDENAMRAVDRYDDESEARLLADWKKVHAQRRMSGAARLSGIVLGHLPGPVQNQLGNQLGVIPARMTLLSTIPALVLLGVCVWLTAAATLGARPSPVPVWLWVVAMLFSLDSAVRFLVAMSQSRPMGSIPGVVVYTLLWAVAPAGWQLLSPFAPPGEAFFMIAPSEEVARRDAAEIRAPLLTLLHPADQLRLARLCGFDYRKTAAPVAWVLLVASLAGIASLWRQALVAHEPGAMLSVALAAVVAADQLRRIPALRRGPAGSLFAPLLRPFARDLLEKG